MWFQYINKTIIPDYHTIISDYYIGQQLRQFPDLYRSLISRFAGWGVWYSGLLTMFHTALFTLPSQLQPVLDFNVSLKIDER